MADPYAWRLARNPLFSPFRVYVAREARTAFILNPKVGTTFLRDMLSWAHMERTGEKDPSGGRYRLFWGARRMPIAPLRDYRHFMAHPSDYRIYGMVRNPFARVASAWRNKYHDAHVKSGGATAGYPRSMRVGELKKTREFAKAAGPPARPRDAPGPAGRAGRGVGPLRDLRRLCRVRDAGQA